MEITAFTDDLIDKYNKCLENRVKKNIIKYSKRGYIKYLNKIFFKYTFFNNLTNEDLKRNLYLLNIDKKNLNALILINFNMFVVDLELIEYSWFVRYKIKTPFAIKKGRGDLLHCLFISFDYYRKSMWGEISNNKEIVIDDETPLEVYLGNLKEFICVGDIYSFRKEDFSSYTQHNFKI